MFNRLTHQASAFVLSAFITLLMFGGINQLASVPAASDTMAQTVSPQGAVTGV